MFSPDGQALLWANIAPADPIDRYAYDQAVKTPLGTSVQLSYSPMTDRTDMRLQVNFKSGMPVYLQIVDQIRAAAASGALKPGEALPSIRPVAEELRINRNTVAKAYAELESLGVIETLPGKGCFLKENHSPLRKDVRRKMLTEEIDRAIVMAHHLQVPSPEFLELIRERIQTLENKRRANERLQEV